MLKKYLLTCIGCFILASNCQEIHDFQNSTSDSNQKNAISILVDKKFSANLSTVPDNLVTTENDFSKFPNWIFSNNSKNYVLISNPNRTPPSTNSKFSLEISKMRKCFCDINEILEENTCVKNQTHFLVIHNNWPTKIETEYLSIAKIEIRDLKCSDGYSLLNINEDFGLLESGEISVFGSGMTFDTADYCIEHSSSEQQEFDGYVTGMLASVCVKTPSFPVCNAEIGETEVNNRTYFPQKTENFDLAFEFGGEKFNLSVYSFSRNMSCDDGESVAHSFKNGERVFKYFREEIILGIHEKNFKDVINIRPEKYCLEKKTIGENSLNNEIEMLMTYCRPGALVIHNKICQNENCVKKCCPDGEIFDMTIFQCVVNTKYRWTPNFHFPESHNVNDFETTSVPPGEVAGKSVFEQESAHILFPQVKSKFPPYRLVFGFPIDCDFYLLSEKTDLSDSLKLYPNGSLFVENSWKTVIESPNYCLEYFQYEDGIREEGMACALKTPPTEACQTENELMYPILLIISAFFLFGTLIVYAAIPDLSSKIQGKCLIGTVLSLTLAYILLATIQLASNLMVDGCCITFGLLTQYFVLASFFWLNVMSYDIWRRLRSVKFGNSSPAAARKQFLTYSAYAWGCPLIISIVTIVMQLLPEKMDKTHLLLPGLLRNSCFLAFDDKRVQWAYLFGFICVIIAVNTGFFVHLLYILTRARKFRENATGPSNALHREWAKLYMKLFLVMGITWIFEASSWISGSCSYWILTDILNSLRGFFIFIIFVCKRDVLKKLFSENSAFLRIRSSVRTTSLSLFSKSSERLNHINECPRSSSNSGANVELLKKRTHITFDK